MNLPVLLIFLFVYLGMMLGRLPGLALDRAGIAAVGAVALLALGMPLTDAWSSIDVNTLAVLLGLMIISSQFRLAGSVGLFKPLLGRADLSPPWLLAGLVALAGTFAAVLSNDIVCIAAAPLLIDGCLRRRLDPIPFLLALACAANVGSAATLIGNPQNILVGEALHLSFAGYLVAAVLPATVGLVIVWAVICLSVRGRWRLEAVLGETAAPPPAEAGWSEANYSRWQTLKGAAVLLGVVLAFLIAPWPRPVVALSAAALIMLSRRDHARRLLHMIDWPILTLFAGLFIVNHALQHSGLLSRGLTGLAQAGIHLTHPATLFVSSAVLSNIISNVPAVTLLLPAAKHTTDPALIGAVLALASTLAGNLIIVGSIANIIVVEQARAKGVAISWRRHARVGIPVTLVTLLIAAAWLCVVR